MRQDVLGNTLSDRTSTAALPADDPFAQTRGRSEILLAGSLQPSQKLKPFGRATDATGKEVPALR
jgi:hypothetical protein